MFYLLNKKIQMCFKILIVVSMAASGATKADIYRWVDENGKVHLSDREPEQPVENIETIETKNIKINAVAEEESARRGREKYLNNTSIEDQIAKEQADKAVKDAAKQAAECRKMKDALDKLNSGRRLVTTDENGERTYMEDDAREQNKAELSSLYNETCQSYTPESQQEP